MATFSVTDLGNFRRCRRKWDWSSNTRQNLTTIGSGAEPLELGGLVHRALADWIADWYSENDELREKARKLEDVTIKIGEDEYKTYSYLSAVFLGHAGKRQQEIITAYKERTGNEKVPPDIMDSLINVIDMGVDMMANYQTYHKQPLEKHMRFAAPEQEVIVPVPGTEHRCEKCFNIAYNNNFITVLYANHITLENSLRFPARDDCEDCHGTGIVFHYLSATLDGLCQDERDNFLVIEHKTYENRPKKMNLYMNDQFTGYAWVVRELGIGKVAGIAYDGMWKRNKPPKYMQREKRAGLLSDLFIRIIIPKENAELDEWGRNLALEINEMANNPEIYPNVPWQGCDDCSFVQPCYAQMRGEDNSKLIQLQYTQREVVRGGQA